MLTFEFARHMLMRNFNTMHERSNTSCDVKRSEKHFLFLEKLRVFFVIEFVCSRVHILLYVYLNFIHRT